MQGVRGREQSGGTGAKKQVLQVWTIEVRHRATAALRVVVALLALGVAGFAIGNVVALGALSRREELSVMRLVGAPRFHVRAPFWIVGSIQGALGGSLAGAARTG